MSDPLLRRTIRRCTAVLLIPLSLSIPAESSMGGLIPLFFLLGAVAYLGASVFGQFPDTQDTD